MPGINPQRSNNRLPAHCLPPLSAALFLVSPSSSRLAFFDRRLTFFAPDLERLSPSGRRYAPAGAEFPFRNPPGTMPQIEKGRSSRLRPSFLHSALRGDPFLVFALRPPGRLLSRACAPPFGATPPAWVRTPPWGLRRSLRPPRSRASSRSRRARPRCWSGSGARRRCSRGPSR